MKRREFMQLLVAGLGLAACPGFAPANAPALVEPLRGLDALIGNGPAVGAIEATSWTWWRGNDPVLPPLPSDRYHWRDMRQALVAAFSACERHPRPDKIIISPHAMRVFNQRR